ncbi:MAG: tetratricopeptide repeat protein [Phycisphaerales bacterium]|nr:tetratricopeptide repeat protein [Phycisphaerales bacterium]
MITRTGIRIVLFAATPVLLAGFGGCESVDKQLSKTPTYKMLEKGDHALEYGQYEKAAEMYEAVLEREPGNEHALEEYGRCMLKLDQPAKAVTAFSTVALSNPENSELVYLLARAEVESGNYDRAFELLRVRANDNQDPVAWMLLAEYALQLDDPDTAESAISRAIKLVGSTSPRPYLLAADLAERLGNDQEALRRLRQAYGLATQDPEVDRRLREYGELPGPSITLAPGE